jgi:hypothetical protein
MVENVLIIENVPTINGMPIGENVPIVEKTWIIENVQIIKLSNCDDTKEKDSFLIGPFMMELFQK